MNDYKSINNNVNKQVKYWHERKHKIDTPRKVFTKKDETIKKEFLPFITISREYGCGGYEVGRKIAEILNSDENIELPWAAYDKKILNDVLNDMGICQCLGETLTSNARTALTEILQTAFSNFPSQVSVYKKLVETIILMAENGHVILVGRAANVFTKNMEKGFHVRLVADLDWRIERISSIFDISRAKAKDMILKKSKERENYVKKYVKFDLSDPHNYHLVINDAKYESDEVARLIIEGMKIKKLL